MLRARHSPSNSSTALFCPMYTLMGHRNPLRIPWLRVLPRAARSQLFNYALQRVPHLVPLVFVNIFFGLFSNAQRIYPRPRPPPRHWLQKSQSPPRLRQRPDPSLSSHLSSLHETQRQISWSSLDSFPQKRGRRQHWRTRRAFRFRRPRGERHATHRA
jgi:hypothetical protein